QDPHRGAGPVRAKSDLCPPGTSPGLQRDLLERRLVEGARPLKSPEVTRHIIETLSEQHPNADTELHYRHAFALLVAPILSAQSTDARVNMVTPALFAKYPNPAALASARQASLEKQIKSTGFFRQKS